MRSVIRVVVFGPPGCGKGTQCEMLVAHYGLVHVSTGDILRSDLARRNPKVKEAMDKGELVSDELVIRIVAERLGQQDCIEKGWVLDGCPRTESQALVLKQMGILHQVDLFFVFDIDAADVLERIVDRRIDPVSGKIYHLKYNPPPADDTSLWRRLLHRDDDTEKSVRTRLQRYESNFRGILRIAMEGETPEVVFVRVENSFDKRRVFAQLYGFIFNYLMKEEEQIARLLDTKLRRAKL